MMDATPLVTAGSSPHARGTRRVRPPPERRTGIIPACAGNTICKNGLPRRRGDHPRMRGEHASTAFASPLMAGSSPHARGTHYLQEQIAQAVGIIPACAGNTEVVQVIDARRRDHPRMRGEHGTIQTAGDVDKGSSPHARGTLVVRPVERVEAGIIPACAGNTARSCYARPSRRDHPRMRGEHCSSTLTTTRN